jgi:hypothetical protein
MTSVYLVVMRPKESGYGYRMVMPSERVVVCIALTLSAAVSHIEKNFSTKRQSTGGWTCEESGSTFFVVEKAANVSLFTGKFDFAKIVL